MQKNSDENINSLIDEIKVLKIKNMILQGRNEQLDKMYRSLLEEIFGIPNKKQRKPDFAVIQGGKLTGPTRSEDEI